MFPNLLLTVLLPVQGGAKRRLHEIVADGLLLAYEVRNELAADQVLWLLVLARDRLV